MPDPGQLVFLIPITAIVMALGTKMLKVWAGHQQEMTRIRQAQSSNVSGSQNADLEALRQEIMRLRDTTTQYDMSVERTLTEIKSRLSHVESQVGVSPSTTSTPSAPRPMPTEIPVATQSAGEIEEQKLIIGGQN